VGAPAGAQDRRVVIAQRRLVGRTQEVLGVDLGTLRIEDRRLDRPVEKFVGVPAEELVERVLAGDVDGEAAAPAAGPAPHLLEARDRPWERDADRRVERADVDPELERVGRDDAEQLAVRQAPFDLAALAGRVTGAVGRNPVGQLLVVEPLDRVAQDQLDALARLHEADRPRAGADQLGEQLGGILQWRGTQAEAFVEQRRVPHRDSSLCLRRGVVVDQREILQPGKAFGELDRVGDRRAREQEPRLGPVVRGDPA
jgi:hypothetical protein